nr:hypothetical protein [Deferribacter autotrophicus]
MGCATGYYTKALIDNGYKAFGIEYTKHFSFITKNVSIADMKMLPLRKQIFGTIYIIGNTLVHVNNKLEAAKVIRDSLNLLESKGKLIIQIMNYDRIFKEKITELSTIETENLIFKRYYTLSSTESIIFKTVLTIKENKETYIQETQLTPIFYENFTTVADSLNNCYLQFFGDYSKNKYSKYTSPLLIAVFSKL